MFVNPSSRAKNVLFNNIFSEMNALANKHQSVNLGHGFPDFPAPDFIKTAAIKAVEGDRNQYTSGRGVLSLRQVLADRMEQRYHVTYNPETDITVTQGATEAIFSSMMALVDPGDEVILFEPCYSTYLPGIQMAGGVPKFYTLLPPDWSLDVDRLTSLFSEKTKVILLNTPHNPTGKVFSHDEMTLIAELCDRYNVIAISDEVYDELVFDDNVHRPLCTYPGMYERTITVSTLGKTFAVTGWKVGWAIAPTALSQSIFLIRLYSSGSGTTPMQEAAAQALMMPQSYYQNLVAEYESLRNYCCKILDENGFIPFTPAGTFFLMADFSEFQSLKGSFDNDVDFCQYLTKTVGVTPIPASTLYHQNLPTEFNLVRFAFCKHHATLAEANKRLSQALNVSGNIASVVK